MSKLNQMNELLGSLAARAAQGLGLKPTEREQLRQWRGGLEQELRNSHDAWEGMKEEIRRLEARLLKKKAEHDAAHGAIKDMVAQEIEHLFTQMDRKQSEITLLLRNQEAITLTLDKMRELEVAKASGVQEGQLDTLAVHLEDTLEQTQQADAALEGLKQVTYQRRAKEGMDVEARLANLDQAQKKTSGLSSRAQERLAQLEKDQLPE